MIVKKLNIVEPFPRFEYLPLPNILVLAESEQAAAPFDVEWFDSLVKPGARVGEYFRTIIMPSLPNEHKTTDEITYKTIITLDNIIAALKKLTPEKIEEIRKKLSF
ncbi:MAG TPA: hypothetical protein PLK58_16640 [Candidatus Rifleibacterium sp.]|nr:hypothetical protein [Candidatus Rifleibacterium sp.]